jgi:hypothetical protein
MKKKEESKYNYHWRERILFFLTLNTVDLSGCLSVLYDKNTTIKHGLDYQLNIEFFEVKFFWFFFNNINRQQKSWVHIVTYKMIILLVCFSGLPVPSVQDVMNPVLEHTSGIDRRNTKGKLENRYTHFDRVEKIMTMMYRTKQ